MDELLKRLADIDAQLDALLGNDELTAEQKAQVEALETERTRVQQAIDRERDRQSRADQRQKLELEHTERAALQAERERRKELLGKGRLTTPDEPTANNDKPEARTEIAKVAWTVPATVKRFGALKNFKGSINGVDAEVRAYRFGMWALARMSFDLPGRYNFRAAREFVERHMVSQTNDANGTNYLIPEEFSRDLIDLREVYGVARRILRREQMTSDTKVIPRRTGGLTAYFVAEGGAGTESTKTWDQVRLTAKDLMVLSRWTNQVNMDAVINFGDDLAGEIAYAFANKEDDCAFNGDGTSTYGGIRGVRNRLVNDGTAGVVTQGTSNTWAAIVLGDFNAVISKLPQYADTPNAVWTCHKAFYHAVMQRIELASGGVTSMEVQSGNRRPRPLFLGYPVEFSQVWPSTTATSTLSCALGDFSLGAAFGDRQMDSIMFSEHATVNSESVFERNEIAIRGTERFDINVHDVGTASVAGPIVGLKTGS